MLTGKFWITPLGTLNVSSGEHNLTAKNFLLNSFTLEEALERQADQQSIRVRRPFVTMPMTYKKVPQVILEAAEKNGAHPEDLEVLATKADVRAYVMQEYGWVRTAKNIFNCWSFDQQILDMIRNSDYWDFQAQAQADDSVTVEDLEARETYNLTVGKLKSPASRAEALKYVGSATSVSAWRNPGGAMRIPSNIGNFICPRGSFQPKERPRAFNRRESWGSGGLTAQIFVGLDDPVENRSIAEEEVMDAVTQIRQSQGLKPDSTFVIQKGIFTYSHTGKPVYEDSLRIIFFDDGDAEFEEHMLQLAEALRERFNQEMIIVNIEKRGVTKNVVGITAD